MATRAIPTTATMGAHVIPTLRGTFTFAGRVPVELVDLRPADRADVMGQRAFWNDEGELVAPYVKSFPTEQAARDYAVSCGVELSN